MEVVDAWTALGFGLIVAGLTLIKRRELRAELPQLWGNVVPETGAKAGTETDSE